MNHLRLFLTAAISLVIVAGYAQKQRDSIYLELVNVEQTKRKADTITDRSNLLFDGDSIVGYESPMYIDKDFTPAKDRTIRLNNGKSFTVDALPWTAVSTDAGIIVKFGKPFTINYHDKPAPLVFYSLDGNIIKKYGNKHSASGLHISKNGYGAIVGDLFGYSENDGSYITLYNPQGNEILVKALGTDNFSKSSTISERGNYFACIYSSAVAHPPNERYNLFIMDKHGNVLLDKRYGEMFNRIFFFKDKEN